MGAATFGLGMAGIAEAGVGWSCLQAAAFSGAYSGVCADLTSQGMDMLTGRQNKYNPGETLMAAATGAAFGYVGQRLFGGTCFVAGTPVQTVVRGKDGKFHLLVKPIEQMKQDDLVLARNEKTAKTQVRRVLKTTVRHTDLVLTVALANAKTHKVVEKITASREHPFYVSGKGFVPAGGLAVGNAIVTRAGPSLVVQSIKWNRRAEGYTVYNLKVEDDHNYFVGTHNGGIWVHNADYDPRGLPVSSTKDALWKFANSTGSFDVRVATREEAEAIRQKLFMDGYTNTTGIDGSQVADELGTKLRTYHWDDAPFDASADTPLHNHLPHLQIQDANGNTFRIFFREADRMSVYKRWSMPGLK